MLALGIAVYLGTHLGAGPAEAAALAWDPPVPFSWSYSAVQGLGALVGWLLGATIGPGTLAVILVLGSAPVSRCDARRAAACCRLDVDTRTRPTSPASGCRHGLADWHMMDP